MFAGRAATRTDPAFADAWYNLSDLLDEQRRVEAAIECLRTALRVAPDYADAMFNLALLLQRKNQYAEAADCWRRYIASDCQSEWAKRARPHALPCAPRRCCKASRLCGRAVSPAS
jgi:hypothetical protein